MKKIKIPRSISNSLTALFFGFLLLWQVPLFSQHSEIYLSCHGAEFQKPACQEFATSFFKVGMLGRWSDETGHSLVCISNLPNEVSCEESLSQASVNYSYTLKGSRLNVCVLKSKLNPKPKCESGHFTEGDPRASEIELAHLSAKGLRKVTFRIIGASSYVEMTVHENSKKPEVYTLQKFSPL